MSVGDKLLKAAAGNTLVMVRLLRIFLAIQPLSVLADGNHPIGINITA